MSNFVFRSNLFFNYIALILFVLGELDITICIDINLEIDISLLGGLGFNFKD